MKKIKRKIKKIRVKNLLFASLIFLLIIPRILVFITNEDYFGGDFAFYYLMTKTIVIDHELPLLGHIVGDLGGFSQGVFWSYILIVPFIIFDGNPIGGKVYMFFISILVLIFGSIVSWKYIGKKEALIISILLGISPYLIRWTAHVWPPYTIPLITLWYLFFLILFLLKNEKKYFILMTASIGAMAHFEIASTALLIPSFMTLVVYFFYKKMINLGILIKAALVFGLFFIPHLIYDINSRFYNLKGIINVLTPNTQTTSIGFQSVLEDRLHLFKTDLIAVFPIFDYRILLVIFIYFLLGFLLLMREREIKKWKKIFTFHILSIIPITFIGVFLIPVERASFWWFTYLTIIYIFFSGIIMGFLFSKNIIFKISIGFIFLYTIYSSIDNFKIIQTEEISLRSVKYDIGIQAPIEYIYEDSKDKPFRVLYITGNNKVTDYKYMFWYIGKSKYNNSQALRSFDFNFKNSNGSPILINEKDQFQNLKKGTYYIIVSDSLPNDYYKNIAGVKPKGTLIGIKRVGNGVKSFIVEKRIIE